MLFLGKTFAGATFKKGENIDQFLLDYCNKTLTEITTPENCDIRNYFFRDQNQLQSVTFGEGCTTLNAGVCLDCSSLRNVYIPNSVTTIESDAFSGCSNVHFIIDNSSSNLRGYPWGASGCSVEWLQGGDESSGDFIFYNDYNTMEQSSQQGNGWMGFIFDPMNTPCINPEALENIHNGQTIRAIEIMTNPYARECESMYKPVYLQIYNYETREYYQTTSSPIHRGNFDEYVRFDLLSSLVMNPNNKYQIKFTFTQQDSQPIQASPATFTMDAMNPECGCYWQNANNITPTEMVAFKLIFE